MRQAHECGDARKPRVGQRVSGFGVGQAKPPPGWRHGLRILVSRNGEVKGDNPAAGFIICSIVLLGARSDARALAHSGDLFRFGFVDRIGRHASNS